ncbi:hypothetical protein NBRC10512_003707 [Rhodotorula toruloides]|uniref:RHTO0S13e03466g1_1 n=2 Tax=Rhodotorula toruloides TaxID=5286 RepID=A0A061BAF9_RHOTO|nr:Rho GTPase-activating protein [Rhodotorula toruloides NP11]EMS22438.1 Rho GTPase-activating protein [Rhodotorula toruloides NP11]CDR46923.1 RHTO0S13e03466g1_1 [Rhodotorula toruloides]
MSSRQPEASTSAHPFEHPVAHSPLSTSPTRYGDHDHLAAHAHYDGSSRRNQPARDGSGSSGASPSRTGSRGPSPARGGSGDSDGGAYRRKGSDTMSSSRQNSGERGLGQIQEHSEAGLAGRGAGGQGLGRGGGLPVLNTHMLPVGHGLLSPASPAYPHHPNDSRASLLPRQRSGSHSYSPSHGLPSSSSTRATPSPTFPPSHSNSTLSSHSHSHSQSGLRSPITTNFPNSSSSTTHTHPTTASNSPLMHPPSRPSSSASHSQQSHSRSQSQNPSADGHSRTSGSRSRGNSATSVDGRESERGRDDGTPGGKAERREKDRSRKERMAAATCAKCELPMTGQFVRALGTVYHLDCFRCMDCGKMVAAKFFPIDATDGSGRQVPLCETDYFRRLNLLCAKCGQALRGSYITALDMKFHVEHFTCEVCPTVFGPQDSYYEHDGSVYCHFHYSTRFAVKCTGCRTAILKQFVEINRNSVDEHWHPECYMIHKFWNIKLAPAPKAVEALPPSDPSDHSIATVSDSSTSAPPPPEYLAIEASETPGSLKARQKHMEEQVYRIWTILSAFEESSAACISEMLRHVSSGHYMEGVGMAEKFVLHVETLFAAIDDLNEAFRRAGAKELQHVREARMLCKKVVNFFMLLSHTHETGARKMSITQDLLSLVTGLAHYLKILIRIALAGSLKLEREHGNVQAIGLFLGRLDRLARDPEANKISATMLALARKGGARNASSARAGLGPATSTAPNRKDSDRSAESASGDEANGGSHVAPVLARPTYGYKSLARAIGTLVGQGEATTDLCEGCRLTIEEECVRHGTSIRWHLPCLRCAQCHRLATKDDSTANASALLPLADFVWVPAGGEGGQGSTVCKECARRERGGSLEGTVDGFAHVTRLEQYAFLLCVALNKLYGRLKQRGVVPGTPPDGEETRSLSDAYRDSSDIKRMKSVQLDRKLSATTARVPQRSTVIQSPSGRTAQSDATDPTFQLFQAKPPVPSRKDQPLVDPVRGTTIPRSQVREVAPPSSGGATPTPSNAVTPTPSPGLAGPAPLPPSATLPAAVQRPHFNRATTAVRIVDDPPPKTEDVPSGEVREREGLGGTSEPTKDEEGLTLADLPKALEAEQKRAAAPDYQAGRSPLSDPREQSRPYASPANNGPKLLSELSALEYFIVKHVSAVLLSSETSALCDVAPLDDLLDIIDARKNTFWGKLFKAGGEKKKVPKKGVFGIPLEVLVERNGADSMHGAGPGSLRVPSFVDDVISAMKQMDMSIEGIFRKNGNIRRLKDLTEALDRDASSVNLSDDNPVQLAALLKKFLRDLPDPLMTFKLFHLFIAAQRVDDPEARKKALHYCCCMMPKAHRDTMEVVFVFLKWVASFSHVDEETGSKMDLQNLATVISPNILYAKGKDPARDESFSAARVVHELLEMQDEFWEVPAECLSILNDQELFSNPSQLTSKEILARAENHIRLNGRATHWKVSRGEASPPRRPGLQEAWSAPAVPGGGGGSRPISTYASPSPFRSPERPTSYSNQPSSGGGGGPNANGAPQPWSTGSPPWPPAPPPEDRFEAPYRRGTEATGSSSSLHRQAYSESGQPPFPSHPMPHTSSSHPYQRAAGR